MKTFEVKFNEQTYLIDALDAEEALCTAFRMYHGTTNVEVYSDSLYYLWHNR